MTASNRSRLSVVMIVRDAAESLRLTLASVRDIADEIVVVDTGSSDKSIAVANEFGANVVHFAWSDDFSAARNFACQQAHCEWLLWLDAGETLSDRDSTELKSFVATEANPQRGYLLPVRIPASDARSSPEQIAKPRLLPRHPGIQFAGRIWESPLQSLTAFGIKLEGLSFLIRRGERELDARLKKQRAQRNLRIAESEGQAHGMDARLWNCMGDALMTLGEHGRAAECFRQAKQTAERNSSALLEAYYGLLTALGSTEEERQQQLNFCLEALDIFPVDAQLLCALGGYLQSRGNVELASKAYATGYKFGQVTPTVWHLAEIREIAAVCHSVIQQLRQQESEAVQFLENCLIEQPESTRIRRRLIEIFIQQGDRESALAHVGLMPKSTPHLEALRSAVRGACFAVQKNLIAAKAYLNASYTHGCRDSICLKWLSLCLLSTNEMDTARRIISEWEFIEPRNPDIEKLQAVLKSQTASAGTNPNLRIDAPSNAAAKPSSPVILSLGPQRISSASESR